MIRRALPLLLGLSLVSTLAPRARAHAPSDHHPPPAKAPAAAGVAAAPVAAPPVASAPAPALAPATPPPALTDALTLDPLVRSGSLPNGLRYFIRHNRKPEARVALRLVVDAGSTAEDDDQQGYAHFSEHMNFNGSTHFQPEELIAYLQSIGLRFGADANAYTSFEETVYMLEVPTDRDTLLERGVLALSDFAGGATMSLAEIEKERGVVLEEWRLGRGAADRMQRVQLPIVYHGSRYAQRLPIGRPEVIEKGSAARLQQFYRDWYTPDRMTVIAVGDIDPDRMERLIRERFAGLKPSAKRLTPPVSDLPAHDSTLFAIATDKEATATSVGLIWKHPRRVPTTVADYRADVVQGLMLAMLNARFGEITHRADAPFLWASAWAGPFGRGFETSGAFAGVPDGGLDKGFGALLREVERARRFGFLASELGRAKDEAQARMARAFAERENSESDGYAREYVEYALRGEPSPGVEAEFRMVRVLLPGITLDEVNAAVARLFHERSRVVLVSAVEKPGVPAPDEPRMRAALAEAATAALEPWKDEAAGRPLMAKPPKAGTIKSRRSIEPLGVTVLRFSNGVEAWLKPTDFKADEIVFNAYALGGFSTVDSADYRRMALAGVVINDAGVGGFTSPDLQKALAGRLVRVNTTWSSYTHGLNGSARPVDLETALQLIHLTFTDVTSDPAGFAAIQQRFRTLLLDRRNAPEQVFSDTVSVVNSGGFYMNQPIGPADVDAATLAPILAFQQQRFANAADFTFFFAGRFDPDSIAPLLATYLGSLPSKGKRTSAFVKRGPRYPAGVRRVDVHKGVEPKATVRMTFFSNPPAIEELDQYRARSLASVLNERLRESLRELMGGTYGASAAFGSLSPLPGYATLGVSFGCSPERVDTMVTATLAEVRRLRDEGPTLADVQKEQEIQRRELEVSMKQNGFWTGSLSTLHMLGWDPLRILERRARIDRLTPADLQASARRYLPLDRHTVITLTPEAGAEAGGVGH